MYFSGFGPLPTPNNGEYRVPNWKKEEVEHMRNTIYVVASTVSDSSKMFGVKEDLDPVYWMLGAAWLGRITG